MRRSLLTYTPSNIYILHTVDYKEHLNGAEETKEECLEFSVSLLVMLIHIFNKLRDVAVYYVII